MAISAGSGIEYWAQPGAGVVVLLKPRLVRAHTRVTWGFRNTVANTLRSGVLRERGRVEAGGALSDERLLRNASEDRRPLHP